MTDNTAREGNEPATSTFRWVRFPVDVLSDTRLSHGARLTYAVLMNHQFGGKPIRVSHAKIGEILAYAGKQSTRDVEGDVRPISAEYSTKSIMRWIEELRAADYIDVRRGRRGKMNSYQLCALTPKDGSPKVGTHYPQGWDPGSPTVGTLTIIRSSSSKKKRYVTNEMVDDELLEMHRCCKPNASLHEIALELRRALGKVGIENQPILKDRYRYAITQSGIDTPIAWAIKETKRLAS